SALVRAALILVQAEQVQALAAWSDPPSAKDQPLQALIRYLPATFSQITPILFPRVLFPARCRERRRQTLPILRAFSGAPTFRSVLTTAGPRQIAVSPR